MAPAITVNKSRSLEQKKKEALLDFRRIPGVGQRIALDLWELGYRCVEDLKDLDPEVIYQKLNELTGEKHCRCMLYVFRCAVYFASVKSHAPHKLKWYHWKD